MIFQDKILTPYEAAVLKGAYSCAQFLNETETPIKEEDKIPIVAETEEDLEAKQEGKEEEKEEEAKVEEKKEEEEEQKEESEEKKEEETKEEPGENKEEETKDDPEEKTEDKQQEKKEEKKEENAMEQKEDKQNTEEEAKAAEKEQKDEKEPAKEEQNTQEQETKPEEKEDEQKTEEPSTEGKQDEEKQDVEAEKQQEEIPAEQEDEQEKEGKSKERSEKEVPQEEQEVPKDNKERRETVDSGKGEKSEAGEEKASDHNEEEEANSDRVDTGYDTDTVAEDDDGYQAEGEDEARSPIAAVAAATAAGAACVAGTTAAVVVKKTDKSPSKQKENVQKNSTERQKIGQEHVKRNNKMIGDNNDKYNKYKKVDDRNLNYKPRQLNHKIISRKLKIDAKSRIDVGQGNIKRKERKQQNFSKSAEQPKDKSSNYGQGTKVKSKREAVKIFNKKEKYIVDSDINNRGTSRTRNQQDPSRSENPKAQLHDNKTSPREPRYRPSRSQSLDRQSRQRDKLSASCGAPTRPRSKSHDPTRSRSRSRSKSKEPGMPVIVRTQPSGLQVGAYDETRPSRARTKMQPQSGGKSPSRQSQKGYPYHTGNNVGPTQSFAGRPDRNNQYYANLSPVPETTSRPHSAKDHTGNSVSDLDSEGTTSTRRYLHKHIPRVRPARNDAHEIQQLVRIFELKTGASQGIHRSRKINLHNRSKDADAEKKIVAQLKNELGNRSTNLKTADDFRNSNEWELYLQGKLHITY